MGYFTIIMLGWNFITTAFVVYQYTTFFYSVYDFSIFCKNTFVKIGTFAYSCVPKMNIVKNKTTIFDRLRNFFYKKRNTNDYNRRYSGMSIFSDDEELSNYNDLSTRFSDFNTVILNAKTVSSSPPFRSLIDIHEENNGENSGLYDFMLE